MAHAALVRAAALAAFVITCGAASAATLFTPIPVPKAARAPELLSSPSAVLVDRETITAAGVGGTLEAPLPNGKTVTIRIDRIDTHENGDVSWIGKVIDRAGEELRAIGTSGAGGTYGELETSDGSWGIVPAEEGHDWLFDKTASEATLPVPARADDFRVPPRTEFSAHAKATCPTVASMPSPQATIDVLAVITPDFVSTHGGAAGAETRLNYLFTNMNAYNAASNIAVTYRRVATINVAYQAASTANDDDSNALDAVTNGSGNFANVAAIRNFYGADMVALFRGPKNTSGNSIAGVAWLLGDGNGGMPAQDGSYTYSVSGDWLFPSATLPAHELGHNMGNAHDRPNAGTGPGTVGSTTYAYGHFVCGSGASPSCGQAGFNNTGTGFGTIMAYHLPTVPKFSSPNLLCKGTQAGALTAPCGVADQQDDVRATNCVRQSVAAFRNSWVGNCPNLTADTDHDGIPDCLEAGSGRVNGVRDNDVFGSALLFSAQQYRDFLSREPEADGLNFWTRALATGTHTRAQMVEGFFNSAEFQGFIAPVARLYFAYFLRIPDYGGLQHWIGQFRAGTTLQQISQNFASSAEFNIRYGALNNQQFVTLIYNNVLGRAPDAAGLAFWKGQLDTGAMNRGQVMLAFSEGPEYGALIANEVYVTMMYVGMLRREPDAGGFAFWTAYKDSGKSGLDLIGGFLTSQEYRNRFLS